MSQMKVVHVNVGKYIFLQVLVVERINVVL